jgi:hypothetical protein
MLPWHRCLLIELDLKINIGGVLAKISNPTTSYALNWLDGSHSKNSKTHLRDIYNSSALISCADFSGSGTLLSGLLIIDESGRHR